MEKKLPDTVATLLTPAVVAHRPVRVMFQDEARFGRMVRPKRCGAPRPLRPVLRNGYEREFVYVYGAVSPREGELDWRLCREMTTVRMGEFLIQVSQAHPREFIVMVVDGASSHKAKDLVIPDNIRLLPLPPYAPELNPQEHVWDELREKSIKDCIQFSPGNRFEFAESIPQFDAGKAGHIPVHPGDIRLTESRHGGVDRMGQKAETAQPAYGVDERLWA